MQKIVKLLSYEIAPSLLLIAFTVFAMVIANTNLSEIYYNVLHFKLFGLSVLHWINDGLMVIFFFYVGLEIKKELVSGELSSFKKAALPVCAALGGMIVPALIYLSFNSALPEKNGWGIPMATDIAFAVGILAFFGKRIPTSVRIFLLAIAIVDDLGAILVIAIFYSGSIKLSGFAIAMLSFITVLILQKKLISSYWIYWLVGIFAWMGILMSGIHATIAGVILGLMTPIKFTDKKLSVEISPIDDLMNQLHHWIGFLIMPVFAFANAGVTIHGISAFQLFDHQVFLGIALGLFFGKPIGILLFSYIATLVRFCKLPDNFNWWIVYAVGCLAGIGFTMSLFISGLALPIELEVYSKIAIVISSICAAVFSVMVLNVVLPKTQKKRT